MVILNVLFGDKLQLLEVPKRKKAKSIKNDRKDFIQTTAV